MMYFAPNVCLSFFITSLPFLSAAKSPSRVLLPKPDGRFEVGMGTTELIDNSRLQLFAPTVEPRRFMVSLFYPTNAHSAITPVADLSLETAAFEDSGEESTYGLESPSGTFEKLALQLASSSSKRNSTTDFPIVLFSPAENTTRLFYNVIAQTIASSGYIVITIDAPHDADFVEYPDGSVDVVNATVTAEATLDDIIMAVDYRAQDASFVLNQLGNPSVVSQLIPGHAKSLDVRNVAMFGHSLGGAATAAAMLNDSRIAGGIAMDGALFGPVVRQGLDRPFMFMAHTNHTRTDDGSMNDPYNSWYDIWANLRSFKLDLMLANSAHYTFSDLPIVLKTLGIVPNATVAGNLLVTSLDGTRALKIVTTYVTAFMDMVLKHKTSPLLQGPVAAFPEVTFER